MLSSLDSQPNTLLKTPGSSYGSRQFITVVGDAIDSVLREIVIFLRTFHRFPSIFRAIPVKVVQNWL